MLDWLIIGGGVIGTTLSNYLVNAYGVPESKLRVLDPHDEPLARWNRFTRNTGMQYLRSPWVHHIDIEHLSLKNYGDNGRADSMGGYIVPYNRPAYRLFQSHVEETIATRKLTQLRLHGKAQFILSTKGGLIVETDQGELRAHQVVLALGRTGLNIPSWAADIAYQHIFEWDFDLAAVDNWNHAIVVGGGITAGQVALTLAEKQPGTVTLVMRHPIEQEDFDSSPCWLGPTCSAIFRNTLNYDDRRRLILEARNRGTMSSDVTRDIRAAVKSGKLNIYQGNIISTHTHDGITQLNMADDTALQGDRVLLATGFETQRPGGAWLDEVIEWFDLPVAACGYPIVDERLRWRHGLYVSGSLAELELGPPAANIIGGQLAARRLKDAL